jgi:hypothetical protein
MDLALESFSAVAWILRLSRDWDFLGRLWRWSPD